VRRVRVPSQSSDVDQYLDDLFMPVLDGNMDMEYDARSLAASIKGGARSKKEKDSIDSFVNDVIDAVVDDQQPLPDAETLAGLIRGGGRKEGSRSQQSQHNQGYVKSSPRSALDPVSPFQPIGINIPTPLGMISPSPMLVPGFYGGKILSKKHALFFFYSNCTIYSF